MKPASKTSFAIGVLLLIIIIIITIVIIIAVKKTKSKQKQAEIKAAAEKAALEPVDTVTPDTVTAVEAENKDTTEAIAESISPDTLKAKLQTLQAELSEMDQNIKAENVKDFSVTNTQKDIDAALTIVEKNYDKWTKSLNEKIESVLQKYESKMPDTRLNYEKSLRKAKLHNGTLVDILTNDLTYQEAKEYFFIENGDLIAYSYTNADGKTIEVPTKNVTNYTDYWQHVPDLYFYLYKDTQPNLTWRSQEAPTKAKILSQRTDQSLPSSERKIYKKIYDNLEMSAKDANNTYLNTYTDVKKAHNDPNDWLHKNDGGDVHYYSYGYEERRVWPTPFNIPTKQQLISKYTEDQFNPNTTSLIDNFNPPSEQYFPMKRYKQTYQRLGYIYDFR